ncbi:site-specific DNA-methyltransferase [Ligilactobacillus salivarius]|uniref:Type III restriction endonuclease subunit M n=1 Tax=Ligilactobacillus salivarius TaxID=1624 RepID=A0A2U2M3U6_9LACO|nr:site-specific DNA-methyltransferase [Ligilactobacillus salivarius]PWG51539.1 type III restriction endonuclease subunit M [Ligilactobacillus salivarius]
MTVESKVIEHIHNVLETFNDKYILDGRIKKTKVIEDLDRYDHDLIKALLSDDLIHNSYTEKIADVEVFKVNQFIEMLEFKKYWEDSYTKYSNKIGLTSGGKFIDESTDVVLDFPFKDTVLKAGMSKEDLENSDDADEPFLNEIIAKPEIDELFEPKILVNARRYDNSNRGGYETSSISDDDNLIIKGNNLIALHSLKKKYAGKVKQIIIDPPYYFESTKGTDAFKYNSDFKLSTWLTFIKNRLDIAKELLKSDGFCFIIIGAEGYAYLKLLADSIFFKENYIGTISWRKSDNQANIGQFAQVTDYILIYKKDIGILNRLPLSDKAKKEYRYSDNVGSFRRGILLHKTRGRHQYNLITPSGKTLTGPWMKTKEDIESLKDQGLIYWTKGGQEQPYKKIYLKDSKGQIANDFWDTTFGSNQRGANEISKLFNNERVFDFPKPEKLIYNLINLGSNPNDLVLDFFMGSATTQAVAMKMNRRFIGIEQLDYINTVSVPRLQKVIEGEQGGISKDVNWQGGGSFVYAELMEKNQGYLKDLQKSGSIQELMEVYNRMKENADIDFRLDLEKFEEEISNFNSLDERRRELVRILDKNQLYYNYANIDDANVRDLISDNDYKFNKSFYNKDGE